MSDVTMSTLESKLRPVEQRIETLERFQKDQVERQRRRSELSFYLSMFAMVLVLAVALTVAITLKAAGK